MSKAGATETAGLWHKEQRDVLGNVDEIDSIQQNLPYLVCNFQMCK